MIGATWTVRAVITLAVAYWLGQAINQTYLQLARHVTDITPFAP